MTIKELRKLRRNDLLEMLLSLSKENEQLRKQLQEAQQKLENRDIILADSESLAEACLRLNGVLEALQAARTQYNHNVVDQIVRKSQRSSSVTPGLRQQEQENENEKE